jgi:hypothetical protein
VKTPCFRLQIVSSGESLGGKAVLYYNSDEWRLRAEQMRTFAEEMRDENCRVMALRIAEDYDRLARQAEEDHADP